MVAVRSAHLNKAGEFDPKKWIASLGISSQQSCERLAETWDYCREKTQGHPLADLLLWRGVEMVEILSTLSMDIDTLRAALLFPLAVMVLVGFSEMFSALAFCATASGVRCIFKPMTRVGVFSFASCLSWVTSCGVQCLPWLPGVFAMMSLLICREREWNVR